MGLIYQNPRIPHDEAILLLASGTDADISTALVSIGLNEADRNWAQDICLKHLTSKTESIVASAATALGHIARLHGELDTETVFAALESAKQTHPSLQGIIEDTLGDIDVFT